MVDAPPGLSQSPPAIIEVYYALTCASCRLGLPVLAWAAEAGEFPLKILVLTNLDAARAWRGGTR